MNQWNVIEWCN